MSITYKILGKPGLDNAAKITVDSGSKQHNLLFDCGDGCLSELDFGEIMKFDHLLFSHLHMDHIGGFDSFFRCNFNRDKKENHIWGPPETSDIIQHRLQGFIWNHASTMDAQWYVHDIFEDRVETFRFELKEAFSKKHKAKTTLKKGPIFLCDDFTIQAFTMDHQTPSMAYRVDEPTKTNIDKAELDEHGLKPGPWIKDFKECAHSTYQIAGTDYSHDWLSQNLLVMKKGHSIAYLTDFLLNEETTQSLSPKLTDCRTIICEAQYDAADDMLAQKNHHMTIQNSAKLAQAANAQELILFHLSERYQPEQWLQMLDSAKSIFENSQFPHGWLQEIELLKSS